MNRNPRYKAREEQSEDANHDCKCAPGRLPRRPASGIRAFSLDHLVGAGEQGRRHVEAERLRGNQIDYKLELRRLLDWYIAGLGPAQHLVDVICRASKTFDVTWAIGHEA